MAMPPGYLDVAGVGTKAHYCLLGKAWDVHQPLAWMRELTELEELHAHRGWPLATPAQLMEALLQYAKAREKTGTLEPVLAANIRTIPRVELGGPAHVLPAVWQGDALLVHVPL